MGFKNVPDVISGIILVLDLCAWCELDIVLMGSMTSQYDGGGGRGKMLYSLNSCNSVPLDTWRLCRLFSVSDLS